MKMIVTKLRMVWIALFAAGCTTLSATPASGQCRSASELSAFIHESLTPIAMGSDSASVYWRSEYDLNKVDSASQVAFVADSATCSAAADAMGATYEPPRNHTDFPLGMWVLAVGPTRYVVFDGQKNTAGRFYVFVFDQNFTYLNLIGY